MISCALLRRVSLLRHMDIVKVLRYAQCPSSCIIIHSAAQSSLSLYYSLLTIQILNCSKQSNTIKLFRFVNFSKVCRYSLLPASAPSKLYNVSRWSCFSLNVKDLIFNILPVLRLSAMQISLWAPCFRKALFFWSSPRPISTS